MADSVFTKIVRGEIPAPKVYEDELTYAFLDQHPVTKGHTLVIPKEQIDHLDDCPPELYDAIFKTVHKLSKHLRKTLKPMRIAIVVHGLEVPHAHVHIVPLYTGEELHLADRPKGLMSTEELNEFAKQIAYE
jgi:histidine triad (HIT) family protein